MEAAYDLLEPEGALVMVVHTGRAGRSRRARDRRESPTTEIRALVEKYLGSTRRAGQGLAPVRTHRFEDVLVRTRFGAPQSIFVPGIPDLVRDSESVLSGYFSMLVLGVAPVRRPGGGLRRRGEGAAGVALARGRVLGLARRHRGDPGPEARRQRLKPAG